MGFALENIPAEYKEDIEKGIEILKQEGCKEVFLFGSLADGNIHPTTDIDLAVKGCPAEKYFHVLGKLLLALKHSVDLVNLDRKDDFSEYLEKEGLLVHVR